MTQHVVYFNVGGRKFATFRSTLHRATSSMLARLADEVWTSQNNESVNSLGDCEQNPIFIDRSGELFGFILDYLRDREHFVLPENPADQKRLFLEAHYFQLNDLCMRLYRKCLRPAGYWFSAAGWQPYLGQPVRLFRDEDGLVPKRLMQRVMYSYFAGFAAFSFMSMLRERKRKLPVIPNSKLQRCKSCGFFMNILELEFMNKAFEVNGLLPKWEEIQGEILDYSGDEEESGTCVLIKWALPKRLQLADLGVNFDLVPVVHMNLGELLPIELCYETMRFLQ